MSITIRPRGGASVLAAALARAFAAAPPAPSGATGTSEIALSLDEAVALALEQSPTYRVAAIEVERARGARLGAEPYFPGNPLLSFDAGPRDQADERGTKFSYQARLEQPVDVAGQRAARLAEADAGIALAEARLAVAGAEVRTRVRAAYVNAQIAARRVDDAQQRVATAERLERAARDRVATGAASEVEQRLAEAERGKAEAERLAATTDLQEARAALATVLDLPPGQTLRLSTALAAPPPRTLNADTLVEVALERRRELLALRQEGRAIDAEIERLRAERIPPVSLVFNMQQDSPDQYWAGPGISIAAPVWRRNQGSIAEAEAARRRNKLELETSARSTERDLRTAIEAAKQRRAEWELLDRSVLRAVERGRDLVVDGWQAGKFDLFRVLTLENDLVNARRAHLDAIAALWNAELEIDRTLGLGTEEKAS
jgi:cobalt-zinc-cadmium efflux system outer membrane protein